jgi:transcription initiation factor IIE alpha subunit
MKTRAVKDHLPPHLIVYKGNCPVCGKVLGEDDSIFVCREGIRKDKEYREQSSQAKEETTL